MRGVTGNGVRKGIILKDGSQTQQYDPRTMKLRRDQSRVQLGEQENQNTRGQSVAGMSSARIINQGGEVSAPVNFGEQFASLMTDAMPGENLLLDPRFDDWSNGVSAALPAMYGGAGGNLFTRTGTGGAIEPLVGRYCPGINWWGGGGPPVLTHVVPIDMGSIGFDSLYHVPFTFSTSLVSTVPGNYARLHIFSTPAPLNEDYFTPTFEIPQVWTRFEFTADFISLAMKSVGCALEQEGPPNAGNVYTDAWKLERGEFATAWVPSTHLVRELLFCVPAATTSFADVAYPGGGTYGLMPPDGEVWQVLGLSAFVGSVAGPGPGAKVEFMLLRDAGQILSTATATAASSWRASVGENSNLNYITNAERLRVQLKQTNVTATNIMISVRYLVY